VELPHHIKQVGAHSVTLKFAEDLTATVTVTIVPEGAEITAEQKTKETNEGE